ncbi:hypothetical protein EQV77_08345 [Halobacillus fulvus]|nr:hypothetical protein EQV77_08345 [Halobacillus fulvus]
MKGHPFDWVATSIVIVAVGIWLFTSFGKIEYEHLTEATVTDKTHNDEGYYVTLNDDQLVHVEDTNMWMLLEQGQTYDITYEWYGTVTPYVTEVNQAHDEDQVSGGH